jgi:uncharacterized protein YceH (UPF0502 family)
MSNHVALRDFVISIIDERDKRYEQRFKGQEIALIKAERELKARLTLLNELRGNVATKDQLHVFHQLLNEVKARLDRIEGRKTGSSLMLVTLISISGLVLAALSLFYK